jgi:hypothetical protein
VELTSVAQELYGRTPQEFTEARDARVSEARQAGDKDLAASLKKLRKPSVGAWLANMLVRQRAADIDHLIGLGEDLRSSSRLDGEQIRRASKEKQDAVAKLLRSAQSIANRTEQPVSQAATLDLEATLDAAFGDPGAAASLREGCLTAALNYSGLGFTSDMPTGSVRGARSSESSNTEGKSASAVAIGQAKSALDLTARTAEEADAELATAQRAVAAAETDLKRLRAAAAVAERRATKAHEKASGAKKKLDLLSHASKR